MSPPNVAAIRRFADLARKDPRVLRTLSREELTRFSDYSFVWQLRPSQRYDERFRETSEVLNLSGRGWGKSLSGLSWLIHRAIYDSTPGSSQLFVGPTHQCFQDTIKGDNNITRLAPESECVVERLSDGPGWYFPKRDHWIMFFSGETPDRIRGPNCISVYFEEFCQIPAAKIKTVYDTAIFAVRKGDPEILISSTPKPSKWLNDKMREKDVALIQGSTFENARNLNAETLAKWKRTYGSSLFGQQELYGKVLDAGGSVMFDGRYKRRCDMPYSEMRYMAIAIDPANAEKKDNDETGILVYGVFDSPDNSGIRLVVFEDLSGRHNPSTVIQLIKEARARYGAKMIDGELRGGKIGYVIAETNNGGHWILNSLAGVGIPVLPVRADDSKEARVEDINPIWQGEQILLNGEFYELEYQLENFTAGTAHDDRVDALVHAVYDAFDLWNASRNQSRSMGEFSA